MERQEPIVLEMYTEISRLKQVIRHFEGVPIPLPIPITLSSVVIAVIWELVSFYWIPFGDPVTKYVIIPLLLIVLVSYFEPENIHPMQWVYAYIRRWIRPFRRVVNRAVPHKRFWREYRQQTYIHYNRNKKGGK